MAATHPCVPPAILDKLRLVCLDLPEVVEEAAWTGTRWTIRGKNFAHVLMIADGWPAHYAKAAGITDADKSSPRCVLSFRTPRAAAQSPRLTRAPHFVPGWWPNLAGMTLDSATQWDDVERHLVESYRVLAPKKLADSVE